MHAADVNGDVASTVVARENERDVHFDTASVFIMQSSSYTNFSL